MLESLHFHFNNISSREMGLVNVNTNSGLFEEIFLPSRTIKTIKVRGNDKSYLQSTEKDNISLPLTFLLPENYTEADIRKIARWFNQDYYQPFYFDSFPQRIFYVMYQGDSRISHNGAGQGYFTIELVSNSPYSYSPVYSTNSLTIDNITNGYNLEIENDGDESIFPEVWITTKGHNEVKINNFSNGVKFSLSNLSLSEQIYIDNEKRDIITDLPLTYRYDNFNKQYLELSRGVNRLQLIGKFEFEMRYQYVFHG